ncbi:hypothetical protein [Streptomyces sp. NPDC058664]|uniref:hypothetical protein n=1 Tax=unclassified Streptomyces TaxID=2593676 RepID=UPI003666A6E0
MRITALPARHVGPPVLRRLLPPVTTDARQGVELVHRVDATRLMPIHYEEYTVMKSPLSAFLEAARRAALAQRLIDCPPGGTAVLTPPS